jgi:hypothetical protein
MYSNNYSKPSGKRFNQEYSNANQNQQRNYAGQQSSYGH